MSGSSQSAQPSVPLSSLGIGPSLFSSHPNVSMLALVLLLLVLPSVAHAEVQLLCTIISLNGNPRPNVSVDIIGPKTIYTQASAEGQFSVTLTPGTYVFRVRDGAKRMEFERQITPNDTRADFRLKW
jgi:hypothetical protein